MVVSEGGGALPILRSVFIFVKVFMNGRYPYKRDHYQKETQETQ